MPSSLVWLALPLPSKPSIEAHFELFSPRPMLIRASLRTSESNRRFGVLLHRRIGNGFDGPPNHEFREDLLRHIKETTGRESKARARVAVLAVFRRQLLQTLLIFLGIRMFWSQNLVCSVRRASRKLACFLDLARRSDSDRNNCGQSDLKSEFGRHKGPALIG